MKGYGQFCPVAKTAEIFAQRWTPLIIRELCFGPKRFGEIADAMPLISRSLLTQRLQELELEGVVATEPLAKGNIYRLTRAGEDLRAIVELMSQWGQSWGQGNIGPEDLNPTLLAWSIKRQIDPNEIPDNGFVVRLEFRGIPRGQTQRRYWWLVLRRDDIEVCLRDPRVEVDVVVSAELASFTRVWMGYEGLKDAMDAKTVAVSGPTRAIATMKRLLRISDTPGYKKLHFEPMADAAE